MTDAATSNVAMDVAAAVPTEAPFVVGFLFFGFFLELLIFDAGDVFPIPIPRPALSSPLSLDEREEDSGAKQLSL
jgi:hypothetical protein